MTPAATAEHRYLDACELFARVPSKEVCVGFSGGKDSLATLSLACKLRNRGVLKRVDAYFMYLVPNLRCLEPKVDLICRKFDVQLWKVPHWNLSRRFKNGILMPHLANTNKLREFRPTDLEDYLRKQTKIEWYAYGHRREDSLERRGMLTSCLGFNEVSRRVYPLWTWGRRYLNAYLKREGLRPPRIIGGVRTGGVGLGESSLMYLREKFPDDYSKIIEIFPYAEAQVFRAMQRQQKEVAV